MTKAVQPIDQSTLANALVNHLDQQRQLAYAQIDPNLIIQQTSDNFDSLIFLELDSAIGQSLISIFDEFIGSEEVLKAVISGEQEDYSLNYVTRETAEGDTYYLNFQVINLNKLFDAEGLLLIVRDVTTEGQMSQWLAQNRNDLRLAQDELKANNLELQQLNNFKSFLLSMLAHDMRTPLAAIRGYSELILRMMEPMKTEPGSVKINNYSNNICTVTDQMTWLIQDIIDFDRAEKGLLSIHRQTCDIKEIIQSTLEIHNGFIGLQEITVSLVLDPPDLKIWADPLRLQQIINNLLGNAIKYSPNGGQITIKVHVERGEMALSVADDGPGMTPEQLEALFTPYYRTKEAAASNVVGSGLGLFIVESLVKAQNGRIEVASDFGQGSVFTVFIPVTAPESP